MRKHTRKAKSLIDIGCGTGDCLHYMKKAGWNAVGIEPSEKVAKSEKCLGIKIYNSRLEDSIARCPEKGNGFDTAILLNILEHVVDPKRFLEHTKKLLKPHTGMVCVRVPNDFNPLQECVQNEIKNMLWWVLVPDHINYFDLESITKLLRSVGFNLVHINTDFPMEIFLLMGKDYIGNNEVGSKCHQKRMRFELSLPDELRRNIYVSLAKLGIGRNCIVYARFKKGDGDE